MNSIQPQTPQLAASSSPQNAVQGWWTALHYQTTELWQTVSNRDTGKIYKEAFWKTWQILTQLGRLLLLLAISLLGIFIFVWLLGFYTGRGLRMWLEKDTPSPTTILRKVLALLLLPFQLATIWLDRELKRAFGWDLKLTQLLPPIDRELLNLNQAEKAIVPSDQPK